MIVLASASPARAAVLAAAGVAFEARAAPVDEAALKAQPRPAPALAMALAHAKAAAVPGDWVIGADQTLLCAGRRLDKPRDLAEARAHLAYLRGRTHELLTAVCVWHRGSPAWSHLARPALTMRPFSDAFLDAYLAAEGEALLGCVGAYRLEGNGAQLFTWVQGEHSAVLGLPLLPLLAFLREAGLLAA